MANLLSVFTGSSGVLASTQKSELSIRRFFARIKRSEFGTNRKHIVFTEKRVGGTIGSYKSNGSSAIASPGAVQAGDLFLDDQSFLNGSVRNFAVVVPDSIAAQASGTAATAIGTSSAHGNAPFVEDDAAAVVGSSPNYGRAAGAVIIPQYIPCALSKIGQVQVFGVVAQDKANPATALSVVAVRKAIPIINGNTRATKANASYLQIQLNAKPPAEIDEVLVMIDELPSL